MIPGAMCRLQGARRPHRGDGVLEPGRGGHRRAAAETAGNSLRVLRRGGVAAGEMRDVVGRGAGAGIRGRRPRFWTDSRLKRREPSSTFPSRAIRRVRSTSPTRPDMVGRLRVDTSRSARTAKRPSKTTPSCFSFRASHRNCPDRSTSRICVRSDSVTWCCTKTAPGKHWQRNSHNFRRQRISIDGASSNRRPGCPRRFSSRSRIDSSRRSEVQATKMRVFGFSS